MKGSWPVAAQATGGRHFRGDNVDQNFDNYSVEYTFDDGTSFFLYGRCIPGCFDKFGSFIQGSKRAAVLSVNAGVPSQSAIYRGQRLTKSDRIWQFTGTERSPYEYEWEDLIDAIRQDTPYHEVERGAEASLVTSMGRMAAHTGQRITLAEFSKCPHEFAPGVDQLAVDGPPPLVPNKDGTYPIPQPGITTTREY